MNRPRFTIRLDRSGNKILIGAVGACGLPDENRTFIIGDLLLDPFHGVGYATDTPRDVLGWARRHPCPREPVADTSRHLRASIRVLEKCSLSAWGSNT